MITCYRSPEPIAIMPTNSQLHAARHRPRLRLVLPAALILSLYLAGCAPLTRDAAAPDPSIPAAYPDQPANGAVSTVPAAAIAWRSYFTDPALRAVVEQALAHNRDLRTAILRVEEARAAYGIQRADRLPTLAASFSGERGRIPGDLNLTGRPIIADQFQFGVGFTSWEIDFWGRVASLNQAALQSYLASDAARRAATVGLIAEVANAYLTLRELDERLALAQRTVDSRAASLRIFQRRVELGATSRFELTQVELLWRQATALLTQLEQARATQLHALNLLVGAPVELPATSAPLDDMVLAGELTPGLPSDLLTQRPDIVAAEHALKAASANIAAARAAFFPRIALTASAATASAELNGLFESGSKAWSFSPTLALPIFDSGRRQAALELAELRRDEAVARYEQTIQSAFRDVSDALTAQRWLADQVATLRATLALQTERARLAKLRYDSGAVRYLEVLDAERERLAVEQQLVQVRRAQLASQVALYAALGGGSQHMNAESLGASGPKGQ